MVVAVNEQAALVRSGELNTHWMPFWHYGDWCSGFLHPVRQPLNCSRNHATWHHGQATVIHCVGCEWLWRPVASWTLQASSKRWKGWLHFA